ncbi:tyrosine-type recombinase/integrase [Micromonospora sp. NPDC053740]|uniref:tyrosine-type recombinase/integrase n=1 Tax=Micromonospora sp. NPDC053740 TaxID=3155173 RepID=UPI0034137F53
MLSGINVGARVRATALSDRYVAETVKQAVRDTGQPPEVVDTLAGHSLRTRLATALEAAGVPQTVIARILGHATGTAGRYVRHAFDGAPCTHTPPVSFAAFEPPALDRDRSTRRRHGTVPASHAQHSSIRGHHTDQPLHRLSLRRYGACSRMSVR